MRSLSPPWKLLALVVIFHVSSPVWADDAADLSSIAPPSDTTTSAESVADEEDPRTKRYTVARPTWGIEVAVTQKAFPAGERGTGTSFDGSKLKGASIQFDYQPTSLQRFGIFGMGPSIALYPAPTGVTKKVWNLWSVGLQARYQARFFHEQILVPMVGYGMEYWSYVVAGRSGRVVVKGPILGVGLLLNSLDRSSADSFFTEYGVSRSYLIAEIRKLSGEDNNINLGGVSYFFGLRFEL